MWSYSVVKTELTNAKAACACGEKRATAARGPSSTPTVTRTTRSSLLSPVRVKDTAGCAPASSASAARHRRVDPRRGRSCTCTTTVSDSAPEPTTVATWSPDSMVTLCCILIAPCDVLEGNSRASTTRRPAQLSLCHTQCQGISSAGLARVDRRPDPSGAVLGRSRQQPGGLPRPVLSAGGALHALPVTGRGGGRLGVRLLRGGPGLLGPRRGESCQ